MQFRTPSKERKIVDNYQFEQQISKGPYSTVYTGINIKNGQRVAIKQIPLSLFKDCPRLGELAGNEIKILKQQNKHIVEYIHSCQTPHKLYIITKYCNGGTLRQFIDTQKAGLRKNDWEKSKKSLERRLQIFEDILVAFDYLSQLKILHRDVKPENIMFHDEEIKLIDFGFSIKIDGKKLQSIVGTPLYMSPQIQKYESYSEKSDVWGLGITLFELLYLEYPSCFFKKYVQKGIPDQCMQIIRGCLQADENKRLGPGQLLQRFNELKKMENAKMVNRQESQKTQNQQNLTQPQTVCQVHKPTNQTNQPISQTNKFMSQDGRASDRQAQSSSGQQKNQQLLQDFSFQSEQHLNNCHKLGQEIDHHLNNLINSVG